jgi:cytosine/adenosine deaminase-related metal-dependent hydrolase
VTVRVVAAPWVLTGAPSVSVRGDPSTGSGEPRTASGPQSFVLRQAQDERASGGTPAAIPDGAIALDGDTVLAVGARAEVEARFGRGERLAAIVLPALVNAHLHLELSLLAGRVQGGEGLAAWIQLFLSARNRVRESEILPAMEMAAEDLVKAGVAAVGDVGNTLAAAAPLAAAGFAGTLYLEVLGLTRERHEAILASAREARSRVTPTPGLRIALSPHAVYSSLPEAVAALLDAGPASIHLAEDPAERELCARGTGPFARLAAALGAPPPRPSARSAVAAVAPHLRAHHLAVHCVDLDGEDVAALRACGATVVLCPRSNRHIVGRLPPLPALLEAGIPLAVGTDSLASSPSLAPLEELAALRAAFPAVPAARLLPLAWNGAAVGAPHVGRLVPGTAPGVLAARLAGADPEDPFEHLVTAFGAGESRPFAWLARQRPEATA